MPTLELVVCTCPKWPDKQDPECRQHRTPDKLVSHSELATYRQCQFKHQIGYLERWSDGQSGPAASRGTRLHSVLENHYLAVQRAQRGDLGSYMEVFRPRINELLWDPETGEQTEEQEICAWMYEGYLDHYGLDDPDWEIVEVEKRFEIKLPTDTGRASRLTLKGTVDLLVKDHTAGGGLWIVDHKTCKNLPKDLELDLDDQAALYMYLLRRHGMNIRGHIRNAIRSERLKTREMDWRERFARPITARLDAELETIALEAYRTMKEAYKPLHGQDRPRSPDTDLCRWKCNFTAACLAGRKGYDWRQFLEDAGFEQRAVKPGPTFDPASQAKTYGIPQ